MSSEENKRQTLRLFDEEFNHGSSDAIDELIAPNYADHSSMPAPMPGPEGFKRRAALLRAAFNPQMTFGEFVAEGDLVAFTWTMTGVHQGVFAGIPATGAPITVHGMNLERFQDGKIVEHWSHFDGIGLLRQIGALPAPRPGG
jgi:predicted ester cyclase